jgi:hypothetical protein
MAARFEGGLRMTDHDDDVRRQRSAALLRLIGVNPTPTPPPIETALPPEAPPRGHRPTPPHKARHRAVL